MNKRYDFDILFTTNNANFVNGTYPNQRVVTYAAKKPQKKIFTEDDLFTTDTFSFGTRIGQINIMVCVRGNTSTKYMVNSEIRGVEKIG